MPNAIKRQELLRHHRGSLLIRQYDVLYWILLVLEVLRVVVCVGWEEELCYDRNISDSFQDVARTYRRTLIPVEPLGRFHASHLISRLALVLYQAVPLCDDSLTSLGGPS